MLLPVRAVKTLLSMSWGGELEDKKRKMSVRNTVPRQALLSISQPSRFYRPKHDITPFFCQKWHQSNFKANTEIPFTLHFWHSIYYILTLRRKSSEKTSSKKLILPDLVNFQRGALVAHGHRAKHHLSKHVSIRRAPRTLRKKPNHQHLL